MLSGLPLGYGGLGKSDIDLMECSKYLIGYDSTSYVSVFTVISALTQAPVTPPVTTRRGAIPESLTFCSAHRAHPADKCVRLLNEQMTYHFV